LKILFFPFYKLNPYQSLLQSRLAELGCAVATRETLGSFSEHHTREPFDILHLHWTTPFAEDVGRLAFWQRYLTLWRDLRSLRRRGVRIVWTVHNLENHDRAAVARERRVMTLLGRTADAVIVHCEAAGRAVAERLGVARAKLRVVPHASYVEVYPATQSQAEARRALQLPADAIVMAFVGLVRPYKNLDELVRRFRDEIAPRHEDARLLIAGRIVGNKWRDTVTAMAGSHPRIHLHAGYIVPEALQTFVLSADLVVLPFREILTSGSMLMALSFGRPVVAPRAGCVGEWEGTAGVYLYDPDGRNGDDLGAALRRAVAERGELAAHGAALRRRMEPQSWAAMAQRTLTVYKQLAAEHARGRNAGTPS
jgi:glycosyltransferase involved in cell wall biosynthesis